MKLLNTRNGFVLAEDLREAAGFFGRALGLLGKRSLPSGQGLLLRHCRSIHMFFMRFAIDVVYVDCDWRVLKVVRELRPWRLSVCSGACAVVELPAGTIRDNDVRPGDSLNLLG